MTTPSDVTEAQAFAAVLQMANGFWVSQIVRTAADLNIAEHLHDGPMSAADIATAENADPSATYRLMRACVGLGLLAYAGDRFAGTPLLGALHKDSPLSVKSYAMAQTAPGHWLTWGRTTDAVRKGHSQVREALGSTLFEYFQEHPQEGALFSAAMTNLSGPVIAEAVDVLDLADAQFVVDVGGADGAFVHALMKRHPHLSGTVLELPHAVPGAEAAAKRHGLEGRLSAEAGDYLAAVPAGDLYLLKYIIHDLDDASAVRVLRNCREAMSPGGRIVVVEMIIDEQDSGPGPLMDIAMLTMASSLERTERQFDALFDEAGLRRVRTTNVQAPYGVMELQAS
jgi:hypothetical protein